jgi:hypothetical protein
LAQANNHKIKKSLGDKTMNYVFTSGAMIGFVVEENTKVLEADFSDLDEDMQVRIRGFGKQLFPDLDDDEDFPISLNDLRDRYEESWESEETSEDAGQIIII